MPVSIEVETVGGPLIVYELFGGFGRGRKVTLPGGAVLELTDHHEQRGADATSVLFFALSIPVGVATSIAANWLYDKLSARSQPRRLRIDRTDVRFDRGEIARIISERIELDR